MEEKTSVGRVQVLEASAAVAGAEYGRNDADSGGGGHGRLAGEVGQIAKSIVFQGKKSGMPFLVIASGANRINERKVAKYFGEALRKPDADYVGTYRLCHWRHSAGRAYRGDSVPAGRRPFQYAELGRRQVRLLRYFA